VLLAVAVVGPLGPSTVPPCLEDRLASAGRYVTSLQRNLAVLVADEDYRQMEIADRPGKLALSRSLASDVAWVPTDRLGGWLPREMRVILPDR
jgi:hypothetical protein